MNQVTKKITEWVFPYLLLLYFVCFSTLGVHFAKIGLPLSVFGIGSGAVHEKLFVMEALIGLTGLLALVRSFYTLKQLHRSQTGLVIASLIGVFLLVSAALIALELREAPFVVIRNSSFCWYLIFPVLLFLTGLSAERLEKTIHRGLLLVFAFLCAMLLITFLTANIGTLQRNYSPEYAMGYIIFLALTGGSAAGLTALATIGITVGASLADKLQRTCLVTNSCAFFVTAYFFWSNGQPMRRLNRIWILFAAVPLGLTLYSVSVHFHDVLEEKFHFVVNASPFEKSSGGRLGIESFREYMWLDTIVTIKEHPLRGIGFKEQVVKRIFVGYDEQGNDQFIPNSGGFEFKNSPPISGPHNSYLNAMARMGVLPGLLLLALHLTVLWTLYRARYWAGFFCCFGQMIYAFFNVGLEGPTRSFGLMLSIALALMLCFGPGKKISTLP